MLEMKLSNEYLEYPMFIQVFLRTIKANSSNLNSTW